MSETNRYLKGIFESRKAAEKRPRASSSIEADNFEEAENGEHPAPKRARSGTKSGQNSDGNDRSNDEQNQQSPDLELCGASDL